MIVSQSYPIYFTCISKQSHCYMKVHLSKKNNNNKTTICFWKSLYMLLHKFVLIKKPFMTWKLLHSLKGVWSSVLQLPSAEWKGDKTPLGFHLCFSEVISERFWWDSTLCKVHKKMFHKGGVKELLRKKMPPKPFVAQTEIQKRRFFPPWNFQKGPSYTVSSSGAIAKVSASSREGRR